ncbi:MAG: TIGR02186 family protein [Salinarimonas sp.]|nr:TIGR02186 family protein [Salinarimonas sp.]
MIVALLVALLATGTARAEGLVISLSNHQVMITSNFTGSQVTLFGAVQRDEQTIARTTGYDVAVVVRGPRFNEVTIRRKERLGPIWINRTQETFEDVPRYLAILSSRPLDDLTSEIMRDRLRLGLDPRIAMQMPPEEADALQEAQQDPDYAEALVRLRMQDGQYFEIGRGVTFITPMIFRAAIPLPAGAPPGNYEVETLLFADGVLLARDITNFELVKTGFEQRVAEWAETRAAAYGFITVFLAMFFGWLASVIFRRD